jgi:hypothetical protein
MAKPKKVDEVPAAVPVPAPDQTLRDATAADMVDKDAEGNPNPRLTYWGPRVEPVPHFKRTKK